MQMTIGQRFAEYKSLLAKADRLEAAAWCSSDFAEFANNYSAADELRQLADEMRVELQFDLLMLVTGCPF